MQSSLVWIAAALAEKHLGKRRGCCGSLAGRGYLATDRGLTPAGNRDWEECHGGHDRRHDRRAPGPTAPQPRDSPPGDTDIAWWVLRVLRPAVHRLCRARTGQGRHPHLDDPGVFRSQRGRELRGRDLRRHADRHDAGELAFGQVRPADDFHLVATLVFGRYAGHRLPVRCAKSRPLALHRLDRARGRVRQYRYLCLGIDAQRSARLRLRLQRRDHVHRRAGRGAGFVAAGARDHTRPRRLALGDDYRRFRRDLRLVDLPRAARSRRAGWRSTESSPRPTGSSAPSKAQRSSKPAPACRRRPSFLAKPTACRGAGSRSGGTATSAARSC